MNQTDYYSLSTTASRIQTPSNNRSNNFTTAQNLLVDKFLIEISHDKKKKNRVSST